jgi:hypothetical protein
MLGSNKHVARGGKGYAATERRTIYRANDRYGTISDRRKCSSDDSGPLRGIFGRQLGKFTNVATCNKRSIPGPGQYRALCTIFEP